ncbi:MAG: PPC domain-containing protein, partial [Planctomycetaceae bacterium]
PESGEYSLEIRDVRYSGNAYWEYSIEATSSPFVTNVYPTAIGRSGSQRLELIGLQLPDQRRVDLSLPQNTGQGAQRLQLPFADSVSNPVPMIVSDLPLVLETTTENNDPAHSQMVQVPAGICGRIERSSDLDCYTFEAKKGDQISVEIAARRHDSQLDSVLRILDAKGKSLVENDDLKKYKHSYADSQIDTWTAPADGQFTLEVRDLHLRGGERFVYFIRLTRAAPHFELYLDTDKTQLTPGTSGVLFANVVRKNGFDAEVRLEIEGLPEGVQASCAEIPSEARDGTIILTADAKSPLSVSQIRVRGVVKSDDAGGRSVSVPAVTYQETYQPGGGRGHWPVDNHVVCVAGASDIRAVRISADQVTLQPGQSQRIDIEIERAKGFDKNVQLDLLFRHLSSVYADTLPKGVTIDTKTSKTLLTGTATQGHVTLKAAPDAKPSTKRQVSVMANISLNFVMKATYSSRPLWVSVVP